MIIEKEWIGEKDEWEEYKAFNFSGMVIEITSSIIKFKCIVEASKYQSSSSLKYLLQPRIDLFKNNKKKNKGFFFYVLQLSQQRILLHVIFISSPWLDFSNYTIIWGLLQSDYFV